MADDLGFETIAEKLRELATLDRVSPEGLSALVSDVFVACGVSRADADVAAEISVYAQMRGSESHGVVHLPLYVIGLLDGTIKNKPNVTVSGSLPACKVIDADHGLGIVVCQQAIDTAIDLARSYGMGGVAVRNSSHFGVAGYYAEYAADCGMIGYSFSNASRAIAAPGGKEALFGTNPIGVGFPVPDGEAIVVDMATAVVARSRIRQALAFGQSIPADWALDAEGRPTTDPKAAIEGSVQAIGGPKGYGLALMVELLCTALSDGEPGFDVTYENLVKRPSNISQFFMVLNPEGFAGRAAYDARTRHIADVVVQSKPLHESEPPRLPGERGHAQRRVRRAEGIPMFDALKQSLTNVAAMLDKYSAAKT